MAFFNEAKQQKDKHTSHPIEQNVIKTPDVGSRVSRCMVISGPIKSCEPIVIDGRVIGDIKSDDCVVVQTGAFVIGSIEAKEVRIDGKVEGPIEAEVVEITKRGIQEGYIIATDIILGGLSDGELLAKESLLVKSSAIATTFEAKAQVVTVYGRVKGDVSATVLLDVKDSGVIEGNIETKELQSQSGSKIYGSVNRYKDNNIKSDFDYFDSDDKVERKIRRIG